MPNKYPRKPTFYHHNGQSVSQIDYIMHKERPTHLEYKVENHDMDPLNVSDHSLVTATVPVILKNTKTKDQTQFIIKKPNWSKCDKEKYQSTIRNSITRKDTTNLENAADEINKLTNILHKAGKASIPNYRAKVSIKPVGKGIWNKEICNASKNSKLAFYQWKNDKTDISKKQKMNKARELLRSAQRRAQASVRNTLAEKIMQSSQNDNKLFHKLVQRQRKNNRNTTTDIMIFNGIEESNPAHILDGWKNYFEELYSCDESNIQQNFKTKKLKLEIQNEIIENLEREKNEEIVNITNDNVIATIRRLKSRKSPGPDGLSSEHLKYMPEELVPYITNIINLMFKTVDVPMCVKEGILTLVHKNGKDKLYPENYRGITVTTVLSTLLEGILKDLIEPKLLETQSRLQRGFTTNTSSLNAAFIVSEASQAYKELSNDLVLLTLDAQKAFDKVHHEILFNKIYHDGITGNLWLLMRNLYRDVTVKVKWNNSTSESFRQELGVRQGARLSTVLYKRYNNTLLQALERSNLGANIGNINVVAPTCADDIAILAGNEQELQSILDIVHNLTSNDLTQINPSKSELVPLTKVKNDFSVYLGDNKIENKNETKHLGLIRTVNNKVNIDDRLKIARRTVYALLGPGFHARQGMSPTVSIKLWKTYVLPRSLYGIEILNYTKRDIEKFEKLQLQVCRQIQGLPNRTANIATHSLLGIEPIEATVDKLLLTFFGGVAQDKLCIEYKIIERQLLMAKNNTNSFVNRLTETLTKYNLPCAQELLHCMPCKQEWKITIKNAIQLFWKEKWTTETECKSTMQFLDIQQQPFRNPHQIWKLVPNNTLEIKKS